MISEGGAARDASQAKRLRRALVLIAAGMFVVLASGAVGFLRGTLPGTGESVSRSEILSAEGAVRVVESKTSAFAADVPSWFETELFSVDAAECFAGADETVWGFIVGGGSAACFADVCSQMEERGWSRVESGLEDCVSFVREEGEARWALVSCSSAGGSTTIVVQLA